MTEKNDILDFFKENTILMQSEYDRIIRHSKNDPGTAGDEGEENWATLIRDWIPKSYYVVTKGQILFPDGSCSPQVDVLILRPEYPPSLVTRRIKKYMAHSVAAAFETKLTLRPSHFKKVFKNSSIIKSKKLFDSYTPYQELHSPIIFGLLSHCFDSKIKNVEVISNSINKKIYDCDQALIQHPKEMPDIVCVADIGTWITTKFTYLGPRVINPVAWNVMAQHLGGSPCTMTGYALYPEGVEKLKDFTPIGAFISTLIHQLAWRDLAIQNIARYYLVSNVGGSGKGKLNRIWQPEKVFSKNIFDQILNQGLTTGKHWHEWSYFF